MGTCSLYSIHLWINECIPEIVLTEENGRNKNLAVWLFRRQGSLRSELDVIFCYLYFFCYLIFWYIIFLLYLTSKQIKDNDHIKYLLQISNMLPFFSLYVSHTEFTSPMCYGFVIKYCSEHPWNYVIDRALSCRVWLYIILIWKFL